MKIHDSYSPSNIISFFTLLILLVISHVSWAMCLGDQKATKKLTVAVVPQAPQSITFSSWAPLLENIGQSTGQCFKLIVPETIPAFEKLLFSGSPDFAFANPYHEVIAKRRHGYLPLVIDSKIKLFGIIVVRSDSPILSIQELQGKSVAFPAPNAFAASLIIRAELAKKGVSIKPVYLNTHGNAYRAVALSDMVAAGGVNNTLRKEEASLKENLKVIYETNQYAPHPFIVNPRVPIKTQKSITKAFIHLAKNPGGNKLLENAQIPMPISSDYQRDFAPLENLKLEKFVVLDEG